MWPITRSSALLRVAWKTDVPDALFFPMTEEKVLKSLYETCI
jgi:hypothetical protein